VTSQNASPTTTSVRIPHKQPTTTDHNRTTTAEPPIQQDRLIRARVHALVEQVAVDPPEWSAGMPRRPGRRATGGMRMWVWVWSWPTATSSRSPMTLTVWATLAFRGTSGRQESWLGLPGSRSRSMPVRAKRSRPRPMTGCGRWR